MKATIESCRQSFGNPPRKFSMFALWGLKISVPSWAKESDDRRFVELFAKQESVLQTGRVVWAAIVQANSLLFEPGDSDCPAAVIYSLDPRIDDQPDVLLDAAHALFSVKGKETDPDLQAFSDKLADEMVMDLKIPVPSRLTGGIPCFYACIMVPRKHLPDGKLSLGLFPLLAGAHRTDAVMILPSKYWPASFVSRWKSGELRLDRASRPSRPSPELARHVPSVVQEGLQQFAPDLPAVVEGTRIFVRKAELEVVPVIEEKFEKAGKHLCAAGVAVRAAGSSAFPFLYGPIGVGSSEGDAERDAIATWFLAMGLPLLHAFADSETVLHLRGYRIYPGLMSCRGESPGGWVDGSEAMHRRILTAVTDRMGALATPVAILDYKMARDHNGSLSGECRVDGQGSPAVLDALRTLPWPKGTYLWSQAYVLKQRTETSF